ncbi:glucose transporter type 1 [Drosophila madeirensis]|uniref:Glucose transporter type 1 n=2 Tax=Drosophila madeirensis TaxID=30013 RepID=A0AAU9FT86_DROMD
MPMSMQQQQQQSHHQSRYATHEYVHCSYEKDVVCDQAAPSQQQQPQQMPQQQQQPPAHSHSHKPNHEPNQETVSILSHCHQMQQQQQPVQPLQNQPRKPHSHSPHHSRHTSPHSHHSHHHHYRRRRRQGSGSLPGAHTHHSGHHSVAGTSTRHGGVCAASRRHRSVTDVSTNSCQDPSCADREVQEIMVRKSCCTSSSRTELAQFFAEDLYGSSSRRPSSCCTSSDYCYQTDSTSLYGSRSSLSRNNSIKSASAAMRKQQRLQHRQPSYTSISLRGLNASHPNSQLGSLTSIFDRAKQMAAELKPGEDAAGSTLERQSSKGALSNDLPEYACSPSPIRWSFLADGKSPTDFEGAVGGGEEEKLDAWQVPEPEPEKKPCRKITSAETACWKSGSVYDEGPSTSAAAAARKRRGSSYHCEFEEESTTVLFHQDPGESFNNCCNNYIQCNSYLDQDLQITSEDIHQYLSKGDPTATDVLNNSKNYPFQPSNALEFQYKNNFQQGGGVVGGNNNNTNTTNTASSDAGECFQSYRASSKETNLNQTTTTTATATTGTSTEPMSPTNINLSTSSNNINIVFSSSLERNANEVKFINNRSGGGGSTTDESGMVGCEGHHAGYLPYTYPSYDYTNMSGNSHFEKSLGIDELPKEFSGCQVDASTTSEHSSSLPSPQPLYHHHHHQQQQQQFHHFESFDAASEHNLLSQPMSPSSPLSGSVNPAGDDDFVQMHHYHASSTHSHAHHHSQSHPQTQSHHSHAHAHTHAAHGHGHQTMLTQQGAHATRYGDPLAGTGVLKRVRKRARNFLRKK